MFNKPYEDNFDSYEENESEHKEYQSIYLWKKVDNLISRDNANYYIQRFNANLMSEIFKDKNEVDNEEIKDKEQKSDNYALYEIRNLENKNTAMKSTTKAKNENKNKNPNIKSNIEMIESFKETDTKFLSNKRRKTSFSDPNGKNNENSLNKKEDIKIKKRKSKNQKKNEYSSTYYIIRFYTLLNMYFKGRVENGKLFDTKYFKSVGSNGYYLNIKLTQKNLGTKDHP